jgi:molybdate transport system substrate-binding protein
MVAMLLATTAFSVNASEVTVAVAANFSAPAQQIAVLFQQESGYTAKLSFGSSGKLYAQIKNGAPFDIFLSADEETPKRLEREGMAVNDSRFVYALGKLVLWSAQAEFVDSQGEVLRTSDYNKLAIANPKFSPYGLAAKETLKSLGFWNTAQHKLVTGESITQTYQFAATGNAALAFIAISQVYKGDRELRGSYWIVPSHRYNPIKQSAVQLLAAKDSVIALAFLAFLKSEKATAIIRNFNYALP